MWVDNLSFFNKGVVALISVVAFFVLFGMILAGILYVDNKSSSVPVTADGIPGQVQMIEFWQGGECIYKAENAKVVISFEKIYSRVSANLIITTLNITTNGETIKFIKSDSISIRYKE
jgi:hypothetical protein